MLDLCYYIVVGTTRGVLQHPVNLANCVTIPKVADLTNFQGFAYLKQEGNTSP